MADYATLLQRDRRALVVQSAVAGPGLAHPVFLDIVLPQSPAHQKHTRNYRSLICRFVKMPARMSARVHTLNAVVTGMFVGVCIRVLPGNVMQGMLAFKVCPKGIVNVE